MSALEQLISSTLSALGGVTAENAKLVLEAVYCDLRASEALLLSTREATALISQGTAALGYSVPPAYLPVRPPSRPSPPSTFPTLIYIHMIGALGLLKSRLVAPLERLDSVYAREARALLVYRALRLECRRIIESLLLSLNLSLPQEFSPAESVLPASAGTGVLPVLHHASGDPWPRFLAAPRAVDLELHVPFVETGTRLLPPFSLDSYTFYMEDTALWDERRTFHTLSVLGAVLVPEATFYDSPSFLVREFCVQQDGVSSMSYMLVGDPESTNITLRLPEGRSIAFIRSAKDVDGFIFSQPALRILTSLSVSDRLIGSTINMLTRALFDALTTLEIRLDNQAVEFPQAKLLNYRGPRLMCPNIAVLKIASAYVGSQIVSVPSDVVKGFVAAAFPDLETISYSHRVRVDP